MTVTIRFSGYVFENAMVIQHDARVAPVSIKYETMPLFERGKTKDLMSHALPPHRI